MGVGGGPAALPRLKQLSERDEDAAGALLALGLLGDASAVPVLLAHLEVPSHVGAAADALALLTGAGLMGRVEEPEETGDDAPAGEARAGEGEASPPMKGEHGREVTKVRPARDPAAWSHWWKEHQAQLPPGRRFRAGEPCSPTQLLKLLGASVGEDLLRRLLAEELVSRYGLDVGFEAGALLRAQARALDQGRARPQGRAAAFSPGRWYLAGALSPG